VSAVLKEFVGDASSPRYRYVLRRSKKKKNCKKSNLTRFFFVHESIILSVELIAPDALSSVLSLCSAAFFVGGKKRMRFV
jgi:hypothetical protein